jgi:hypothetical protein
MLVNPIIGRNVDAEIDCQIDERMSEMVSKGIVTQGGACTRGTRKLWSSLGDVYLLQIRPHINQLDIK